MNPAPSKPFTKENAAEMARRSTLARKRRQEERKRLALEAERAESPAGERLSRLWGLLKAIDARMLNAPAEKVRELAVAARAIQSQALELQGGSNGKQRHQAEVSYHPSDPELSREVSQLNDSPAEH